MRHRSMPQDHHLCRRNAIRYASRYILPLYRYNNTAAGFRDTKDIGWTSQGEMMPVLHQSRRSAGLYRHLGIAATTLNLFFMYFSYPILLMQMGE